MEHVIILPVFMCNEYMCVTTCASVQQLLHLYTLHLYTMCMNTSYNYNQVLQHSCQVLEQVNSSHLILLWYNFGTTFAVRAPSKIRYPWTSTANITANLPVSSEKPGYCLQ